MGVSAVKKKERLATWLKVPLDNNIVWRVT
jgi:hypothetical protein